MRPALAVLILALLITVPSAIAGGCRSGVCGGNGAGVEVLGRSTGTWDIWRVNVTAAGTLAAALSWVSSPGGADYDMTLWVPGADLDGVLRQDEIIATSWTVSNSPGESISRAVTPHALRYVITVEPVNAKLETYTLNVTGGKLIATCHGVVGAATFGAVCMPAATGSTKVR